MKDTALIEIIYNKVEKASPIFRIEILRCNNIAYIKIRSRVRGATKQELIFIRIRCKRGWIP